jgi:leucyl aminopeptidase
MLRRTAGFAHPVECWLALAENNIHPEGYRPDEVLTCVTGETVEVVHTDAEGRLLLVDSLALASRLVTPAAIFGADTTAAAENAGGYSAVDTSSVGERGSGGGDARREQDNSNTKKADPCTTLSPKLLVDFGTLTGRLII